MTHEKLQNSSFYYCKLNGSIPFYYIHNEVLLENKIYTKEHLKTQAGHFDDYINNDISPFFLVVCAVSLSI